MFAIAFDLIVEDTRKRHPMNALKSLQWFAGCVRDIRAFRVDQWSDFTGFFRTT